MYDLNDLLPAGSGWQLTDAWDINDAGQIAGFGRSPQGKWMAILLTPIPEPSVLVVVPLSVFGVLLRKSRKH